jgi:7,8-dihydropterin-6-yl-methyl-4-(beta-D-ribofuranosyl)aminobenzene 5'-phosphate synthase
MKATCLVDDAVQRDTAFWGEHGLAYLIEAAGRRVLFDTGQSGAVLLHNLKLLDIDPATIDALAISHAHYDHTGGLPDLLPYLRPGTPLFANADLFRGRFARRDGPPKFIGSALGWDELSARLTLKLTTGPQEIVPGVWTTGEISKRTDFEGCGKELLMAAGGELIPDAYRDDMALVLRSTDHLALLCGCCHAGILNTLAHVARLFPEPVALIIGGLHLASAAKGDLHLTRTRLAAMPALLRVYLGHCTGEAAFLTLAQSPESLVVQTSPVGTVIEIT